MLGYVVMPEHFHLLITEPQKRTPSTVMQALKLGFARRVLAQMHRRNPAQTNLFEHSPQHIWQKRFYDFNVWTEHKRIEKLRYMRQNPVKRGLVASPELWRWSSLRPYFLREAGPVSVNDRDVLTMKSSRRVTCVEGYRQSGRPLLETREKWRTPSCFWSRPDTAGFHNSLGRCRPPAEHGPTNSKYFSWWRMRLCSCEQVSSGSSP